jgi:hypothetical protein
MSYTLHAIYNTTTGQVTKVIGLDPTTDVFTVAANIGAGEAAYYNTSGDFYSAEEQYFPSGVLTTRPKITNAGVAPINYRNFIADGADTVTWGTALPNPTYINFDTPLEAQGLIDHMETSGSLSLKTMVPGNYNIEFRAPFPYQAYTAFLKGHAPPNIGIDCVQFSMSRKSFGIWDYVPTAKMTIPPSLKTFTIQDNSSLAITAIGYANTYKTFGVADNVVVFKQAYTMSPVAFTVQVPDYQMMTVLTMPPVIPVVVISQETYSITPINYLMTPKVFEVVES